MAFFTQFASLLTGSASLPIISADGGGNLLPNTADPPPEVFAILERHGLTTDQITAMGWYAQPKLGMPREGLSPQKIVENGLVDAQMLLEPLLDNLALKGTLRTMDTLNGCSHQCDTCYNDSPLPTRMFSADSLERLFGDKRFLRQLQRESLRFGSVGDLLNHPHGVDIVEMVLRSTRKKGPKQLKVYTNYRPRNEPQIDRLVEVARANPDRLEVALSLPFNRSDVVNLAFQEYVKNRPQFFDVDSLETWKDGMFLFYFNTTRFKNVNVHDVRHPRGIIRSGRVPPMDVFSRITDSCDSTVVDPRHEGKTHMNRGLVKTFLNPDALWLKVYATIYESHTTGVFTPIAPQTLSALKYLQYHPDFETPPYWPGGSGVERSDAAIPGDRHPKPVVVVGIKPDR